jgi:hypothetical protein
MARPVSSQQAVQKAQSLLVRRLPGARRTTVQAHLVRTGSIAESLYAHWQVGAYQWRVKHLRWFLEHRTVQFEPSVRYRYWLTIRLLVIALGRELDWLPRLRGTWTQPLAIPTTVSRRGRPLKRPT